LGRRLLKWAEQQAAELGYRSLKLYTNERFTENIRLYQGLGYCETRREAYLDSTLIHFAKALPT
jgi:GNAT superfamily N-acetyltransferase